MCSLFGLIDFKECLSTHTKNKILNTLAQRVSSARYGRDRYRLQLQWPSADLQAPDSRSEDEDSHSARCERRSWVIPV